MIINDWRRLSTEHSIIITTHLIGSRAGQEEETRGDHSQELVWHELLIIAISMELLMREFSSSWPWVSGGAPTL